MKKSTFNYKATLQKTRSLFSRHGALWPIESVWMTILSIFVFVNILVLVWSFILFLRVSGDDVFAITPQEETSTETLNRKQLEDLLTELRERQARFEALTRDVAVNVSVVEDGSTEVVSEEEDVTE